MQNYLTESQMNNLSTKILLDMKPILQKRIKELLDETLGEYIELAVKEELAKYGYEEPALVLCKNCMMQWRIKRQHKPTMDFDYCPHCGSQNVVLCQDVAICEHTAEAKN